MTHKLSNNVKMRDLEYKICSSTRTKCYFTVYDMLDDESRTKAAINLEFDISWALAGELYDLIPKPSILNFVL